jgi:hypothetical protein
MKGEWRQGAVRLRLSAAREARGPGARLGARTLPSEAERSRTGSGSRRTVSPRDPVSR